MKEFITANQELLKYPIMISSIVLGLFFAKVLLDIDFNDVTEVGLSGVKFRDERKLEVKQAVAQNDQFTYLKGEIEALKQQMMMNSDTSSLVELQEQVLTNNIEKAQTVSYEIAQKSLLSTAEKSDNNGKTLLYGEVGFIWIGDKKEEEMPWKRVKLLNLDEKPIEKDPSELAQGQQYKVSGNMVLRVEKPLDNTMYYNGIEDVGVIPAGTKVELLASPVRYKRIHTTQYWVKVKVIE